MARDRTISIEHSAVLEKWRFTSILSKAMSAAVAHLMKFRGRCGTKRRCMCDCIERSTRCTARRPVTRSSCRDLYRSSCTWTHKRKLPSAGLTTTAAGCLAGAHGIFWGLVAPANSTIGGWNLNVIPAEWHRWRNQWEVLSRDPRRAGDRGSRCAGRLRASVYK